MIWSKIEPATGRRKYIKKFGNNVLLTTNKSGAEDDIPEGWEVVADNKGILRIRRER